MNQWKSVTKDNPRKWFLKKHFGGFEKREKTKIKKIEKRMKTNRWNQAKVKLLYT
jgi:hypothetical protein